MGKELVKHKLHFLKTKEGIKYFTACGLISGKDCFWFNYRWKTVGCADCLEFKDVPNKYHPFNERQEFLKRTQKELKQVISVV